MVSFAPGSVVLFREPETDLPPWPAVYCTDDVAPQWFLQARPHGYPILVLRLSMTVHTGQLRWASPTDLSQFDPFAAKETRHMTPGFLEAYDAADSALDSGLGLKHWKSALASDDDDPIVVGSDDDMSEDAQMLLAIELSMEDLRSQEAQFSTSSVKRAAPSSAYNLVPGQPSPQAGSLAPSHFENQRDLPIRRAVERPSRLSKPKHSSSSRSNASVFCSQLSKRPRSPSSSESDDSSPLSQQRRKTSGVFDYPRRAEPFRSSPQSSQSTTPPTLTISDDDEPPSPLRQRNSSTETRPTAQTYRPRQPIARSSNATASALSARQVFMRNGLSTSAAAVPIEDSIEEDLGESSQFVQVYVGPEVDPATDPNIDPQRRRHKLQLLKHDIWDRPYFRDPLAGKNHFSPVGENTWELVHPSLADISPEDFRMAAEFLSDESFGTRDPDTEEQVAQVFAECVSAWKTAELLDMDDLLEHIVDKIRGTRPWWDLFNVMLFACFIYESDNLLPANSHMKTMLSDFIAEHYDVYIEDDSLRADVMTRLKQLPELRRDVHKKIAEQTGGRLEPAQDEEEEK